MAKAADAFLPQGAIESFFIIFAKMVAANYETMKL